MNFENTEVAFKAKTSYEIKKAWLLFWLLSFPWFVGLASKVTLFLLKIQLPITWLIRHTLYQQFCGGSNRTECQKTVQLMARFGVGTILDYAIEGAKTESVFDSTARELLETINLAKGNKAIPFTVFKVTGVASHELLEKVQSKIPLSPEEKTAMDRATERVTQLCKAAYDADVSIFIDAEETWIQEVVDDMALSLMRKFNTKKAVVYNTLQLYRTNRIAYLKELLALAKNESFILGLKLVRGAYMEKERAYAAAKAIASPVFDTKLETDKNYNEALKICIEQIDKVSICAGTHNQESTELLISLMEQNKLTSSHPHIYFSQLYGMSDNLTYNLAAKDYNVSKYVPYGPVRAMMPYLFRRAEENSSIQGQTTRELELVNLEIQRRKLI